MVKKEKPTVFSCKLADGEFLEGPLIRQFGDNQHEVYVIEVENLQMHIPRSSCIWFAFGKKPYSVIRKRRFEEMKAEAKIMVEELLAKNKSKGPPINPIAVTDVNRPIQPEGQEQPVLEDVEPPEVRAAYEKARTVTNSGGTMHSIASHQHRVAENASRVVRTIARAKDQNDSSF